MDDAHTAYLDKVEHAARRVVDEWRQIPQATDLQLVCLVMVALYMQGREARYGQPQVRSM